MGLTCHLEHCAQPPPGSPARKTHTCCRSGYFAPLCINLENLARLSIPTVLGPHPTFYLTASSSQLNLHIFHMRGRLNPPLEREDYILGPADSSNHNFLTQPLTQSHWLPIQSLPPQSLPAPFSLPESLLNVNIPSLTYLEKGKVNLAKN